MNQNALNSIFRPTIELIRKFNELCCENIAVRPNYPIELLNTTTSDVIANLKRFDSTYKRSKYFKSHTDLVGSVEHGIGTHWELKRNKQTKVMLPHHVQSVFKYIPILSKIQSIFDNDEIRKTYFDFNEAMNHVCNESIYKDYCCGEKLKQNMLYKDHPNSLRLQLFVDAFDVCDALKTKSNVYSQVAFYFMIRNFPDRFAYNMINIHLLSLVNASDLKKIETSYTNVLKMIVRDIKVLETEGIDLDCGTNLKGKMYFANYSCINSFTISFFK